MEKPIIPAYAQGLVSEKPLTWRPLERRHIVNAAFRGILGKSGDEDYRPFSREYSDWVNSRYLLPGSVTSAVEKVFDESPFKDRYFTHHDESEYTEMLRRFEQEYLNLEQAQSTDGLRWWYSPASGGGHGNYPTDVIASLLDMSSEVLLDEVRQNKEPIGHVMIRSGNYLIPVTDTNLTDEQVVIGDVMELTPEGVETLNLTLMAYELGLKEAQL